MGLLPPKRECAQWVNPVGNEVLLCNYHLANMLAPAVRMSHTEN